MGGIWLDDTNKLKILRTELTALGQTDSIEVTATDQNDNELKNTITVTILGCDYGNWKCELCQSAITFDASVSSISQSINDRTQGCSSCLSGFPLM